MSDATVERDYRDTLNLPKTSFPMKADLPRREPDRVAWWQERRIYERRLERNAAHGPWILHDGPPYANGQLHMGHFLNMVLKDVFVKIALLDGKWAKFVPGWDMHGLPIEIETLKHLHIKDFHAIDPIKLREECKARALHWLEIQRSTRMRMGNFGDWEHPYRTIDPEFEATIVEVLGDLAESDQIYKGLRSTLWCIHDETALAEAEIEYKDKISPSVTVRFTANEEQRRDLLARFGLSSSPAARDVHRVSILIWTTTPWTLPANVAIAVKPDATYGLYKRGDEGVIVAEMLAPRVLGEHFGQMPHLGSASGQALRDATVRHPFMDRDSVVVGADYVDLETGTGAVHTAPGHGADDFETGLKNNLPVINPVNARGIFTAEAGPYAGLHIWKANPKIVEDLLASGALWDAFEFTHSYPHCWRCHNPVIFRATAQWFIAMDQNRLRRRTIDNIRNVQFTPAWGEQRMIQMLENHPEWCISRQRTWGTPIPALICRSCNESVLDARVARLAARRFREHGADAWWRDPVQAFLPSGFACRCGGTDFEKEYNIVDIWFESGVTHLAVLGKNGLPWPGDVVLEGGDQYRGWFRSSVVTATAVKGAAPYRHVVKNGWVNDEQGRPMSKSLGTGIDATDAMQKWGADVLRLWAASVEFVDDVRFGPHVIDQVSRVYRNIRNRVRFMLGNLDDLQPDRMVSRERMQWFDRLACEVTDDWVARVAGMLKTYQLHDAYLEIIRFEGEDLSSFYLDALKDRLYSSAADSERRRSAQSAILHVLNQFLSIIAPLLSFTAEEAWQSLPARLRAGHDSVFDLTFNPSRHPNTEAQSVWRRLKDLRSWVAASEGRRDYELQARVALSPAWYDRFVPHTDDVREALVVSALTLERDESLHGEDDLRSLAPAQGEKCRRCWKYVPLGSDPAHPGLCASCAAVVRSIDR
ncbi:MAG TPA: isoleucine--tRNA ligase [Candidatus Baltobacteraceae bacterium]|jgi:isoleucyl-tRNA synthetase|nr:isoleucine--tRNA ligase [Candidatus Baltobacteraceae bacterium]